MATLAGTVSDDGLSNPPAATAAWSMSSGPAPVTFADANAAATTVQFKKFGTYVLRLTAADPNFSVFDEVTIAVHPNPSGDFNGDWHVDGLDFLIWQSHFGRGMHDAIRSEGDANGDGRVDGLDFLAWQGDYGLDHQ